jgi:ABC-2 type transport system ATP-binding protein
MSEGESGAYEIRGMTAAAIGEAAAANRVVLHELAPEQASLEEAFMRLTKDSVEYHAPPPGEPRPKTEAPA